MKEEKPDIPDITTYNVGVDISTWDHIEKQVAFHKSIDKSYNKRRWVIDCILEKLTRISAKDIILQNKKHISFGITSYLQMKIEKVLAFYRKFDPTYSKNQFFMDAIREKVAREQRAVKNTHSTPEELETALNKLLVESYE